MKEPIPHPFYGRSPKEAVEVAKKMSQEEIEKQASVLTIEQLQAVAAAFSPNHDSLWQGKLRALYRGLFERRHLEALAQLLTSQQALEILDDNIFSDPLHHPKLSPLFVGLSNPVFAAVIAGSTPEQLHIIQNEAGTEPVQHQLTLLMHALGQEEWRLIDTMNSLKERINAIEPSKMTRQELNTLEQELGLPAQQAEQALLILDKALAITWNSGRQDLIEKFSQLKEHYSHDYRVEVGIPHNADERASGLYALLMERLEAVYGEGGAALDLDDAASDALASLSVWYLKDYWEIGLLPHIVDDKRLLALLDSEGSANDRESLRQEALDNLKKAGLNSVGDFKAARIYSKAMLMEYLQKAKV